MPQTGMGAFIGGKRWLSEGIGLAAARGMNVLLGVTTVVLFARALQSNEYGIYVLAVTVVQLVAMPLHMGLPTLLTREIAAALAAGREDLVKGAKLFSLALIGLGSLALALLCLCIYAVVTAAGWWQPDDATLMLALAAGATIPVIAFLKRSQGMLAGFGRVFQGYLPEGVLRPALLLVTGAAALWLFQVGATGLMATYLGAAVLAAFFSAWLIARGQPAGLGPAPAAYHTRAWLTSLVPLTGISAVAMLNSYSDILMLGILADTADVAQYKVAAQAGAVALLLQTIGNALLAPRIAAAQARGDSAHLQRIVTLGARVMTGATTLAVIAIVAFGQPLIAFVFGPDYSQAFPVTVVFALGALVNVACGPTTVVLNMTHRERTTARLAFTAALGNIALNLALIPLLGPLGAALATVVTTTSMQMRAWLTVRRDLGFRTDAFFFRSAQPC